MADNPNFPHLRDLPELNDLNRLEQFESNLIRCRDLGTEVNMTWGIN